MKPSVGRIVHYVSYGTPGGEYTKECRAAIVTFAHPDFQHIHNGELAEIKTGVVNVTVFNPEGIHFNNGVEQYEGDDKPGGTWHWPERELAAGGIISQDAAGRAVLAGE